MKSLRIVILKEFQTELKQGSAFQGVILYLTTTIFITYLSFNVKAGSMHPKTWNTIFWIIMLFSATTGVAKSFIQERRERFLYYYQLVDPAVFLLGKMIYNFFFLLILFFAGYFLFALVLGNPVQDLQIFSLALALGALGFSSAFTIISAMASYAKNSATIMALLGFPIILPLFLMLLSISKAGVDGLAWSTIDTDIVIFMSVNAIVLSVSFILFPYLWRT